MEKPHDSGLLIIKASAGSGKTFTLAKRFIELLLFNTGADGKRHLRKNNDYHRHILAITFTNKATDEMKKRIVDELHILATDTDRSEFYKQFIKEEQDFHIFADGVLDPDAIRKAARAALDGILFNYGAFNVSTIDAFFQSILRNFARELDRDYNYEVQIDENFAMMSAIHNFLITLGNDRRRMGNNKYQASEVEKWVQQHLRKVAETGKPWTFFNVSDNYNPFADIQKLLTKEELRLHIDEIREYLTKPGPDGEPTTDLSRISEFKKTVNALIEQLNQEYTTQLRPMFLDIVSRHGIQDEQFSGNKPLIIFINSDKLEQGAPPSDKFAAIDMGNISQQFKKGKDPDAAACAEICKWVDRVCLIDTRRSLLNSIAGQLPTLGLIGQLDEHLRAFNRDNNAVLIADTNDLIAEVLRSGIPFVYERVGTWINHFMIDEFQDTSRKQYDNFKPLLEESLVRDEQFLCMLIGDSKQSIYRFRNADASLFRDKVEEDFTPERHNRHNVLLDVNFRSMPHIIDFNNSLVKALLQRFADKPLLMRTYTPNKRPRDYEQEHFKTSQQGLVRINFDNQDPLQILPEYLLELHQRFPWKSIGILVSENDEGALVVKTILDHNKTAEPERQINVISDDSLLLNSSPAVRRLVGLLRFIDLTRYVADEDNADEDNADEKDADENEGRQATQNKRALSEQRLFRVLTQFYARLDKDEGQDPGTLLTQCFRDNDEIDSKPLDEQTRIYAQLVSSLLPDRTTEITTLDNIVEKIIAALPNVHQETAYLLAFQDCVRDFSSQRGGGGTIKEFLRFWDAKGKYIKVSAPGNEDAIAVTTIHKAKGLEFDCVVIPWAEWCISTEKIKTNIIWITPDQWYEQGGDRFLDQDAKPTMPPLLPVGMKKVEKANRFGILNDYIDTFNQNVLIDNVNKTYVAFTRPREELHLFTQGTGELHNILRKFADEQSAQGLAADNGDFVQWGEPRATPLEPADELEHLQMPPFGGTNVAAHIAVSLPREQTDRQTTGARLHNLLSRIDYRRDLERAWQFCVNRRLIGDDPVWPKERVWNTVRNMFDDPKTAIFWADDNEVYTERSIVGINGKEVRRPDRVIRRPDGQWIVIDFKFGRPTDQEVRKNKAQVRNYCLQLERVGCRPVKGYLWYADTNDVVDAASD